MGSVSIARALSSKMDCHGGRGLIIVRFSLLLLSHSCAYPLVHMIPSAMLWREEKNLTRCGPSIIIFSTSRTVRNTLCFHSLLGLWYSVMAIQSGLRHPQMSWFGSSTPEELTLSVLVWSLYLQSSLISFLLPPLNSMSPIHNTDQTRGLGWGVYRIELLCLFFVYSQHKNTACGKHQEVNKLFILKMKYYLS